MVQKSRWQKAGFSFMSDHSISIKEQKRKQLREEEIVAAINLSENAKDSVLDWLTLCHEVSVLATT